MTPNDQDRRESDQPRQGVRRRFWNRCSEPNSYWLTRFMILRLLGLVYFVAFLVAADQNIALVGERGLTPARMYLEHVGGQYPSRWSAFAEFPGVFWFDVSDRFILAISWIGAGLSFLVIIGFANAIGMALLWFLYMSIVHIGQVWYGFGWEIQLLETGFLAIFLCPLIDPRPFPKSPPPAAVIWLFRWLIARIMIGAGLIKFRGDACWRDLTCLMYHYETQPIPNPLSRYFHFMPAWFNKGGVLFNHFTELCAPWFMIAPRLLRHAAGLVMISFQVILILSGNLSFLNWLTLVPCLGFFDDSFWRKILPGWIVTRCDTAAAQAGSSRAPQIAGWVLASVVAWLSIAPVKNLFSTRQIMNTSFNQLHLVNTYGAFGSVGKTRAEIVIEGTRNETPTPGTVWKEYEFKCKPGNPNRSPCLISPYHERLDWLMWFAAMSSPQQYPWTIHLIWKFLHNDPLALSLIETNPFPDSPPKFIRAELYLYQFVPPGDPSGAVWKRTRLRDWLPPLSIDHPGLRKFLAAYGWIDARSG